mmetsp:Transcript_25598/g.80137  ORF Transcript_25598/g.80137 Transcript_25598/m.80137 type:complete len:678 (-) Transcript_25598:103-2136(-)
MPRVTDGGGVGVGVGRGSAKRRPPSRGSRTEAPTGPAAEVQQPQQREHRRRRRGEEESSEMSLRQLGSAGLAMLLLALLVVQAAALVSHRGARASPPQHNQRGGSRKHGWPPAPGAAGTRMVLGSAAPATEEKEKGVGLLRSPFGNKGLTFSTAERHARGLEGLMPAGILDLEMQAGVAVERIRSQATDIDKYLVLAGIQSSHADLYYALLMRHMAELMPFVYTPTVGEACQKWSKIISQAPRGLYLSLRDKGNIRKVLDNWPEEHISAIVFTDGERILGLGDLGVNGMGIPIGKLALYTACAGIHPRSCLPVHIDVGTNNEEFLADPGYVGLRHHRDRSAAYDELVDEFITAARDKYGDQVLLQFEDFGNQNAFRFLHKYQDQCTCFNDDIQGTASVVLGGLLASERLTGVELKDQTFLFYGAGEAGVGIANLIASAISKETGESIEEARKRIYLMDSAGLITDKRAKTEDLAEHKLPYAHADPHPDVHCKPTLADVVRDVEPTVLLGVSAQAGAFTKEVIRKMKGEHPLILALSNPTSKAECTAKQAYEWSHGKAIFASGSPFAPVKLHDGEERVPGQGNNAYVFPGIGLGAIAAGTTRIDDEDMYIAAKTLAETVSEERLAKGCLYPPLSEIRDVSAKIATAIALRAHEKGAATVPMPENMLEYVRSIMYDPFA